MPDLVEGLRTRAYDDCNGEGDLRRVANIAADEIDRLNALLGEARESLVMARYELSILNFDRCRALNEQLDAILTKLGEGR